MKLVPNVRRFLALAPGDRRVFLQAEVLFVVIRPALRILGLRRTQELLRQITSSWWSKVVNSETPSDARRTVAVMQMAARHTFGSPNCLPQSLVCWALLRRRGIESELRIGTRKVGGEFEAHAWVEYQGQVLNDRSDVRERFATFDQAIDSAQRTR